MQGSQTGKTHASLISESVWFKTKLVSQFLTLSFLLTQPFYLSYLHAAPIGGEVVDGTGTISQTDLTTTINQSSQNLAIDWQSFDVDTNERVQFIQPNTSSIALNRILGNNGSTIQGQIDANGQVILVNPNGIFFTSTATINVGGLVASSLDMTPSDFMNGNYVFNEVLGTDGAVINSGIINASVGGNVALIGKQVKNDGLISANLGSVILAAGKQSILTFDNQGLIGVQVTKEVLQDEIGLEAAVINSGDITAAGGRVLLTASTSQDVFSQAVNSGVLDQATSVVVNNDGTFTLGAGADVLNTGSIDVSTDVNTNNTARIVLLGENITSSGQISADVADGQAGEIELHAKNEMLLTENSITSAQAFTSGQGGLIKVLGDKVGLFDFSQVNASGANGGGDVLIGGDQQGLSTSIRNAIFIYLGENTSVNADATLNGDGGKIITFAKDTARIHASLFARGGFNGGDGGFIETSGLKGFEISKAPDVSAVNGDGGLWLIDPNNIRIINDTVATDIEQTSNITTTSPFETSNDGAILEVGLIKSALVNGDVVIETTSSGTDSEQGNITFEADLDINNSGNRDRTLDLIAQRDITFADGSSIFSSNLNTDDSLNIRLTADFNNDGFGNVNFNDMSINTYGGDLDVVNAQNVNFNAGFINTFNSGATSGGGDLVISQAAAVTFNGATINTASGDIDIQNSSSVDFNGGSISTNSGLFSLSTTGNVSSATSTTNSLITSGGNFVVNDAIDLDSSYVDINVGNGDIDLDGTGTGVTGNVVLGNLTALGRSSDLFIRNATDIRQFSGTSILINNITDLDVRSGTGLHSIVLESNGNDFFKLKVQGNEVIIKDINELVLQGGSNITSLLEITAAGNISNDGDINVSNASNNAIAIFDTTTTAGAYGNIILDNNSNFDNVKIVNANDVTLNDISNGIAFEANNGADTGGVLGNLVITSTGAGNINDMDGVASYTGEINVAGTSQFSVASDQSIYLDVANNTFGGNVTFLGYDFDSPQISNISIVDNDATGLILSNIAVTGDLTVSAGEITFNQTQATNLTATTTNITGATGNINQSNYARVSNITTLNAVGNIDLSNTGNDFDRVVISNAINATIADWGAIELGKITVSGNLDITSDANKIGSSTQNITQVLTANEGITVGGTSTFSSGAYDVILTNTDNDFDSTNAGTGAVYISARRAEVTDSNALVLGNINLSAVFDDTVSTFISGAVSSGGISQLTNTSIYNDDKNSTITRFDANGSGITLANYNIGTNNDFDVIELLDTNGASVTDTDAITLGDINVIASGNLTVDSGLGGSQAGIDDITNAQIIVAGTSTFTSRAGTTNKNIVLDSSNSNYNVLNIINANDVTIVDNVDSVGIQGAVTGNLSLTAKGTSTSNVIENSGALTVSGNAEFIANDNESIDLSNTANIFSKDPTFTANSGILNNISITDTTSLILQDNLVTQGDLTAKALTVSLQDLTIGNNLNLTASSTINQVSNKSITITGTSTLDGITIDLSESGNDFQGGVTVTNTSAVVTLRDDVGGISLGTATNTFASASLDVESTDGDISQNNSITTGASTLDSDLSDIRFDNTNNDFSGLVNITAANDVFIADVNALAIESSNSRDLNLTSGLGLTLGSGTASTITVDRDLIIDSGRDVNQTASSTLTVAGDTSISARSGMVDYDVSLLSASNDFNAVNIVNALNVDLRDTISSVGIQGNISGKLEIISEGFASGGNTITNPGELNVASGARFTVAAGQSIDLSNINNTFDQDPTFIGNLNNLNLSDSGALVLQSTLDLTGDLTLNSQSLSFNNTTVGGDLYATTSTGLINQLGLTSIIVTGTSSLDGGEGGIDLNRETNDFGGEVSLQTTSTDTLLNPSNVRIRDANDILLGASNIQGNLTVTADNISQVDVTSVVDGITVTNAASFIALPGNDIILNNPDNNFNSISFSSTTGAALQNVSITNAGDLNLGTINVSNDLTAISSGDITNSGRLTVGGLATVNANNITLNNLSNDFTDIVIENGNNVLVTDVNTINFVNSSVISGDLTVNATTGITDDVSSQIQVTSGIASFNVGDNTGNLITLDSANHDFNQIRVNAGGDVTISDINGFDLGTSNVRSNLYLIADSDNDQNISNITNNGGTVTVQGVTDITTYSGSDVTLNNNNNNFVGYLTFNETGSSPLGTITISNTNVTVLNDVNANNLTITSTGTSPQNISQTTTSNIAVANNTLLASGTSDIILNNSTNDFSMFSVTNANNVTVTDANSITVGSIKATGTVIINSNGMTLGDISANSLALNSGTSSISDGNGTDVNIETSGEINLTATGGIGHSDPLEIITNGTSANLTAINNGSGNIEITNNGNITLTDITNNADDSAFIYTGLGGDVTITKVTLDKTFTNTNAVAEFNIINGDVLGDPNSIKHIEANTASFDMNGTGSIGDVFNNEPLIVEIPYKLSDINSLSTYIKYFENRAPFIYEGANEFKNKALQAIENLSGQQLIDVEALADVDEAIFTDVRNYSSSDIALMMPSDQRYTEDEEETLKRQKYINTVH